MLCMRSCRAVTEDWSEYLAVSVKNFSLVGIPYTSIHKCTPNGNTQKCLYAPININTFFSSLVSLLFSFFFVLFGVLCYALWILAVVLIV